jgi:hypothetical protein
MSTQGSTQTWFPKDLATPLLRLQGQGGHADDFITLGQTFEGFHIFGAIGSGKTSGGGQTLARTMLYNGYGGLVMTVKRDEIDTWDGQDGKRHEPRYMGHLRAAGREKDAVIVDMNSGHQFNPFLYEMNRPDGQGKRTENLVELLRETYKIAQAMKGKGTGGSSDPHWDDIRDECLNRTIDLLKLAEEEVAPLNMRKLVGSIPQSEAKAQEFIERLEEAEETEDYEAFQEWLGKRSNYCFYCISKAFDREDLTESQAFMQEEVRSYFMEEYPEVRTENERGSIQSSFKAMIEPFLDPDGVLGKIFSQGISDELRPERCFEEGKIIILDLPTEVFGTGGVYAQTLYRLVWQRAMMRRNVGQHTRPVFLWIDECSVLVNRQDGDFFSKCRSQRVSCVLLNQQMSKYYARIAGRDPKSETHSMLANLNTHIFHYNGDPETNKWAADMIGKSDQEEFSTTAQSEDDKGSATFREQNKYDVPPEAFRALRQGGTPHLTTEAYIVSGVTLSDGKKHTKAVFDQTFMS